MAAAEYARRKFGARTHTRARSVSVSAAAATQLLEADPRRTAFVICNLSSYDGYVGFTDDVSATNGLLIEANGGKIYACVDDDGELVTAAVYALNTGAGGTYYVVEVIS